MSYLNKPIYETKTPNSKPVAALFHQDMSGLGNYQGPMREYCSISSNISFTNLPYSS